jgi:hypothetical protein
MRYFRPLGKRTQLGTSLAPLRQPHLDNRLPGHTQATGLPIQRVHHPHRKVDIDPTQVLLGPAGPAQVQCGRQILTSFKGLIKVLCVPKALPLLFGRDEPR